MTNEQPTPETDAFAATRIGMWQHIPADFARKLERERDELREALSGRTVSCSRCNEAGYKLVGFEAEVAGLRAENEDLRDEARNALHLAESAAVAAFDERDRLMRENERLQAHLDELTAATIHSCGDHCQRPNCVRRREMAAMREAIRVSLIRAYTAGYRHGHEATNEGGFIPVHHSDETEFHAENIHQMLCDGSLPEIQPFTTTP